MENQERKIQPKIAEKDIEKGIEKRRTYSKEQVSYIYDGFDNNRDRIGEVLYVNNFFLESEIPGIDKEKIKKEIEGCESIEKREEFINKVVEALRPVIVYRAENPDKAEELIREKFKKDFISVNELLYYGVSNERDRLHIHIAPNSNVSLAEKRKLFLEGMRRLAEVVKNDERIKTITGTSWIIAEHPKLLEKHGFTLTGPINEQEKRKYFRGEHREIHGALMTREELIKRYL